MSIIQRLLVLGFVASFLVVGTTTDLHAADCTAGEDSCIVNVDGIDFNCLTNLGIDWTEIQRTSQIVVSRVDFKRLQTSCGGGFKMELDQGMTSTITVRPVPGGSTVFPGEVTVEIFAEVEHHNGTILTSPDPLVLESLSTVDEWPPPSAVTYRVTNDVTYTGGANTVTIYAGNEQTVTP